MTKPPAKRELKQERAERTRGEILESAIRLFARQGFLSTTMADLAKAIKMSSGALYWHFPTKEDILLAAIDALHQRFVNYFGGLLTEGRKLPAREQLIAFMALTNQVLKDNREHAIFFSTIAAECVSRNARVEKMMRETMSVYVHLMASIIRYGQKKGEFRPEVDPMLAAHGLVSAYLGMIIQYQLFEGEVTYDPLMSTVSHLMVDGLEKGVPRPQAAPPAATAPEPETKAAG